MARFNQSKSPVRLPKGRRVILFSPDSSYEDNQEIWDFLEQKCCGEWCHCWGYLLPNGQVLHDGCSWWCSDKEVPPGARSCAVYGFSSEKDAALFKLFFG